MTAALRGRSATPAITSVSTTPKLQVDNAADRAFNGAYNELSAVVQIFTDPLVALDDAAKERHDAARALLRLAFAKGRDFTQRSMDTQYKGMRDVVKALRADEAKAAVKTLRWEATVGFLEALLAPYGVAVHSPDGADVEKLSDAWHEAFSNLTAALVGALPASDALRVAVLDEYEKQVAEQSAAVAARRRAAKKAKQTP